MAIKQLMTDQPITAEQFTEMPEVPGKRFELVRGELVEMPGAGFPHARLVMALVRLLDQFVIEHDLGEVFADGLNYLVARMPDSVRVPDASFIAAERIPEEGFRSHVPFAPDLAIEIVSPGDQAEDVYDKVSQYLEAGTRLVWVVWPKFSAVSVYTRSGAYQNLGLQDELEGGDVLPGFRVRVAELFDLHVKREPHT
jgi:Uma2 family endonuclease